MAHSNPRIPGNELLEKMLFPRRSEPDALTVGRIGPALGRRYRPRAEETDEPAAEPLLPAPQPRPESLPVRLFNPAWDRVQGEFGAEAGVSVDAELPEELAHLTRVEFECWPDVEDGRKRWSVRRDGHVRDGKASATFPLARPDHPGKGNPVATCGFLFQARHSRSAALSGGRLPVVAADDETFDGAILYSPARAEYLVCDTEPAFRSLKEETDRLRAWRERSRLAWEKPDPDGRARDLDALAGEVEAFLGGPTRAQAGIEELLLVRGNPRWGRLPAWNYIAARDRADGTAVSGHYRRINAQAAQKKLDGMLHPASEAERKKKGMSRLLTGKIAAHLFSSPPREGAIWEWRKPEAEQGGAPDKGRDEDPSAFRYGAEAAAFRYRAGWDGAETAFDPVKMKIRFGTSGQATGSLFEGQATLGLDLPDAAGLNLLGWLRGVKHGRTFLIDPRRRCLVKLCLEGSVSAFLGATVQASLTLNLDRLPKESLTASAGAFAGAQVRASAQALAKWSAGPTPFQTLGGASLQGGFSAGVGAEGRLKIEYEGLKFRFEMSASAALGLGMKGGVCFEADVAEAWKLIGHLLDCVDFHFVAEISGAAYSAYANYAFASLTADARLAQAEVDWARERMEGFRTWLERLGEGVRRVKANLMAASGRRSMLCKAPPQALGQAIRTIMRTRERDDYTMILFFLHSTVKPAGRNAMAPAAPGTGPSGDHKLKWTLRYVSDLAIPDAEGPERERMKTEALRDGVARIRAFATDEGASGHAGPHPGAQAFAREFNRLLADNGVALA